MFEKEKEQAKSYLTHKDKRITDTTKKVIKYVLSLKGKGLSKAEKSEAEKSEAENRKINSKSKINKTKSKAGNGRGWKKLCHSPEWSHRISR